MDCVDAQPEETPLHRLHRALSSSLPGRGRDLQSDGPEEVTSGVEPSSLQARLPFLTRRMRKMCVQMVKKMPLPELSEDLDQFTAEIIANVQALQSLTVDRSVEQERQKAEVKHILLQKQRALADLFKMLAQIGLSYRKGLTWSRTADPEEPLCLQPVEMRTALSTVRTQEHTENALFAEMSSAWDGCQKYFYRSWARRNAMQTALQTAAKELGLGNVERCRGFSSHLFKLLLRQRRRLAKITEHWVHLRKLIDSVQDIRSHVTDSSKEDDPGLPPQDSLHSWVVRAQALAQQCTTALQQFSWVLQCCPEGPSATLSQAGQGEATLSHPSPLAPHLQPQACLMRRGEAGWSEAVQKVEALHGESTQLKEKLNALEHESTSRAIHTWNHMEQCCSYVYGLGSLAGRMVALEQLFVPEGAAVLNSQPSLTRGLHAVRGEVDTCVTEFTAWKSQLLSLGQSSTKRPATPFRAEFSEQVERTINTVLCAVQSLVKRRERETDEERQADSRRESDSEAAEELLKPGHLSRLLEEDLSGDVSSLSLPDVVGVTEQLLERLRSHRDACSPQNLGELREACRSLARLEPMLGVYSELVRWYVAVCMGAHRSTGKLLSILASLFTDLGQKGFCLPQELMGGGDGEGSTEFHDYEGGGIGEGEGVKDVSDKIENEDQVEDTFREGQEKEEEPDQRQIKEEDNAIEMSEDFEGTMHDGEAREPGEDEEDSDEEQNEELDKKMGDLGDGPTDTLDERMWGDEDDDDDDLDDSDKEEESGPGMDQGESELVAKDDNTEAGESNKDKKNQDKDNPMDSEDQKEKVHEQIDEREFDENEVDPYHGKQEHKPEAEAMDLPEDLNLDQDEQGGEDEEGDAENPYDIEDKPMEVDEAEGEGEEERSADMMEDQQDGEGEEDEEQKGEEEAGGEQAEGERDSETDERGANEGEEDEKEKEAGQEEGREEDKAIPADQGQKPKEEEEEEEAGDDDDAQIESAERKEHATDGQTGEENVQSETAVELAGAASERDQAKEEDGSGAADASQAEGHDSKLMARMSSQKQRQKQTQSFKRKPGRADNERSLGDASERVNKRLRTMESAERKEQEQTSADALQESDLYEHIRQGEEKHDAQTYDAANTEQQRPSAMKQEEDDDEDGDVAMDTDEEKELQAVEAPELKPDKMDSSTASKRGMEEGEMESQKQADREEDEKPETKGSRDEEERKERSRESTIHTVPELLMEVVKLPVKDPELLRRELELQLEDWQRQTAGSPEEESAAAAMWQQYQTLSSSLSQQLCEQLRLILEPTQASKLKGDYRTGKRLNMRKVIPYIASQFRKDKIWLRRTKPSKRDYQICLAVDDSSSMVDNHSKQLAFESVSVIVNALMLLEVGQVAVCSFGESVQLLHPFHQQFNDQSGARILRLCQFQQKKTRIAQFLEASANMFVAAKQQSPGSANTETAQLLLIVSDGRGLFLEGKERVASAVQAARSANVFIIFVVLDNPNSRDSILDIKVPIFKGPGELPEIRSYMEEFPFPFYVILRDVNNLPETLSDALRQWFELVTATDQ